MPTVMYKMDRDLPGLGPVVKSLPSNAGNVGLILVRETKASHSNYGGLVLRSPCTTTEKSLRATARGPHTAQ